MITHYDLFAGIGGFSIAVDEVFDEPIRHIFCEWEAFPTEVLKKHWPDGEFWGDIADLVDHTKRQRLEGHRNDKGQEGRQEATRPASSSTFTLLTGGFPCQPFSQAGQRRGTADDRYKWPEMFEVIRNVSPEWVIAENVAGLVNWSEGMVLEQVCTDLEGEGYEVWPLVIPAVAVNAPHRRDRVWIVGYAKHARLNATENREGGAEGSNGNSTRQNELRQPQGANSLRPTTTDTEYQRPIQREQQERPRQEEGLFARSDWERPWIEVATELCSLDDGLPARMGDTTITKARHRQEQLKAYGNAIVPQVAIEIMKGIRDAQAP